MNSISKKLFKIKTERLVCIDPYCIRPPQWRMPGTQKVLTKCMGSICKQPPILPTQPSPLILAGRWLSSWSFRFHLHGQLKLPTAWSPQAPDQKSQRAILCHVWSSQKELAGPWEHLGLALAFKITGSRTLGKITVKSPSL